MELKELMEKAQTAKTPDELLALAKEMEVEMSSQEAEETFALLNKKGELSDEELDNVAGGGCDTTVDGKTYTVVSSGLDCFTGQYEANYERNGVDGVVAGPLYAQDNYSLRFTWKDFAYPGQCGMCRWLSFKAGTGYCSKSAK